MVVESKLTYEECRRQRVEENKKRMEELNLSKLALALKPSTPKPSPTKQVKPRARLSMEMSPMPLRRSGRMSDKPPPNYKEMAMEPLERIGRCYQRRGLLDRVRASDEVRQYAIERADKLESELDSEFPTFVKPMLLSHVSGGFWLGLPCQFCNGHLPKEDEMITLVDEDGEESLVKYLAAKNGLSGGWRGFSIDHDLVDGDTLVFQLVKPTQFQVYIIRAHQSDKDDKEESKENNEDIADTPPSRSVKRTRNTQSDYDVDDNKKSKEDICAKPSSRGVKKTRKTLSDNDDDDAEKSKKDINVKPSRRSIKRTRKTKSDSDDDDDYEKSEDNIDYKPSRTRKTQLDNDYNGNENNKENNSNVDVESSGIMRTRSTRRKKVTFDLTEK